MLYKESITLKKEPPKLNKSHHFYLLKSEWTHVCFVSWAPHHHHSETDVELCFKAENQWEWGKPIPLSHSPEHTVRNMDDRRLTRGLAHGGTKAVRGSLRGTRGWKPPHARTHTRTVTHVSWNKHIKAHGQLCMLSELLLVKHCKWNLCIRLNCQSDGDRWLKDLSPSDTQLPLETTI